MIRWIFHANGGVCLPALRLSFSFFSPVYFRPSRNMPTGAARCQRKIWRRWPQRQVRRWPRLTPRLPTRQTRSVRALLPVPRLRRRPELTSQGGVLEVTFKFLTATDSQGLVRYCYVTDTGLEAPTLRVNPGDQLIIHFQNDLPAASASSASDNMAGMKMSLSSARDHQQQQCLQWNDVSDCDQYPLPWNQCGARLRTG